MHIAAASGPIYQSDESRAELTVYDADNAANASQLVSFDDFYVAEREGLIRAVTLVVGSPVTAADVVDEALLRAYQRWAELSQRPRPGGWVFRVAVNLGRSRYRRMQREIKYRWLSLPTPGVDHTAEAAFAERIEDDRLLAAVLELPIEQRSVLVARILLDYSEAEVAAALGISAGTVKSRLSRALAGLRRQLPDLDPSLGQYLPTDTPEGDAVPHRPTAQRRAARTRSHGDPSPCPATEQPSDDSRQSPPNTKGPRS